MFRIWNRYGGVRVFLGKSANRTACSFKSIMQQGYGLAVIFPAGVVPDLKDMAGRKSRDYDNGYRPGDSPGMAPARLNVGRSPGIN